MPPPKLPFTSGRKVFIKKQRCPGIICQPTEAKGTWKVETLNAETGAATGTIVTLTSQQMKNLSGDEFPFLVRENEANIENELPKTPVVVQTVFEDDNEDDDEEGFERLSQEGSIKSSSGNDEEGSIYSKPDSVASVESKKPVATENNAVDDADWELLGTDADLAETELIPYFPNKQGEEETFNPNDAAASNGIELDEDKHKAKWETYKLEKQALVDNEWTVKCGPPKQDGIDIGVRVHERTGQKRMGTVLFDDRAEFQTDDGPLWGVVFDGGTLETADRKIKSTKLKRHRDKRVFKWKMVEDSTPERPPIPYQNHGVIGFDFQAFAPEQADLPAGDPSYNHPFLHLLEHIWPGSWRDHLRNLNTHIERENSAIVKNRSKRKKRLVSGTLLCLHVVHLLADHSHLGLLLFTP